MFSLVRSPAAMHPLLLKVLLSCYRPQQSCGQGNIFTPVCHSVHKGGFCLNACWDTPPPEQTPLGHPPGADTHPPEQTLPWEQTPPKQTPPWSRHPPPEQTPPWEQTPPPSRETPPSRVDTHPPPPPEQTPTPGSGLQHTV